MDEMKWWEVVDLIMVGHGTCHRAQLAVYES